MRPQPLHSLGRGRRAGWSENLRRRRSPYKRRVGPDGVVAAPPSLDEHQRLAERVEEFRVAESAAWSPAFIGTMALPLRGPLVSRRRSIDPASKFTRPQVSSRTAETRPAVPSISRIARRMCSAIGALRSCWI